MLHVVLDQPNSKVPERKTCGSAGYDLYACESAVIKPHGFKLINTGIRIKLPQNSYMRIAPRSGLAVRGIDVGAGVIDSDYTGVIHILLFNHADTDFNVTIGDRIAQGIIESIMTPDVQVVDSLQQTERGCGGFGSTGK